MLELLGFKLHVLDSYHICSKNLHKISKLFIQAQWKICNLYKPVQVSSMPVHNFRYAELVLHFITAIESTALF